MDQIVSKIAALGVPGLVLLVAMAVTGWAGAAAITTALAMLGGPFGMLGGVAVLGILVLISQGLAEYGFEKIFQAVVDELRELPTLTLRYSVGFPIHWGLPRPLWIFYVPKILVLHPLQGQKR